MEDKDWPKKLVRRREGVGIHSLVQAMFCLDTFLLAKVNGVRLPSLQYCLVSWRGWDSHHPSFLSVTFGRSVTKGVGEGDGDIGSPWKPPQCVLSGHFLRLYTWNKGCCKIRKEYSICPGHKAQKIPKCIQWRVVSRRGDIITAMEMVQIYYRLTANWKAGQVTLTLFQKWIVGSEWNVESSRSQPLLRALQYSNAYRQVESANSALLVLKCATKNLQYHRPWYHSVLSFSNDLGGAVLLS